MTDFDCVSLEKVIILEEVGQLSHIWRPIIPLQSELLVIKLCVLHVCVLFSDDSL